MKLRLLLISFYFLASIIAFSQDKNEPIKKDSLFQKCKLKYPSAARKNGIQGTVEIKVIFDQNCNIKEYKVIKSLGYGCDEAAIECLINTQEKVKKEKKSNCEEGYETTVPFQFKLG